MMNLISCVLYLVYFLRKDDEQAIDNEEDDVEDGDQDGEDGEGGKKKKVRKILPSNIFLRSLKSCLTSRKRKTGCSPRKRASSN